MKNFARLGARLQKCTTGENLVPFECIFWIPHLWCNCLKTTEDL
jgi:hypothetical protein